MLGFLEKLFSGGKNGGGILSEAADIVDRFVDSKDDKFNRLTELMKLQAEDRANARNLYGKDSSVQKIYALIFLLSYVTLTGYFIYWAFNHGQVELTDFQVSLTSSVWGAMSTKVSTVTDFFFGASDSRQESSKTLYEAKRKNKDSKLP